MPHPNLRAIARKPILARLSAQAIERFWSKVDRKGANECWDWTGICNRDGYGNIRLSNKWASAHRVALVIDTGEDHLDLDALHSCDRPICCNPNHLRWGTHADNVDDRIIRRRTRVTAKAGFNNPQAKISPADLERIVAMLPAHSNTDIAREVCISADMISCIRTGKSWRDEAVALGWSPPLDRKSQVIVQLLEALDTCLDYCMLDWEWDDPRAVKARQAMEAARSRMVTRASQETTLSMGRAGR